MTQPVASKYDLTDPQCPGLQLRVRGGTVSWAVRARLHRTQRRWIVGGPDIKPDAARDRAGEVKGWCRRGVDPEKLITEFATGIPISHQLRVSGERPPPSWSWLKAVDQFMEHIAAVRTPATYDDYARTLGGKQRLVPTKRHAMVPELKRFDSRQVAAIGREEIAECVAEVCKRKNRLGSHLKSVLGSLWTFLGDDARRRIAWLELQVKGAIALDSSLLDAEAVGEAIFKARYGDERWEKRVARTMKHGVGVMEYPFAGKRKESCLNWILTIRLDACNAATRPTI